MDAASFHARCDGRGPTLTVARTAAGHVLGGYAAASWETPAETYGKSVAAPGSFLFALRCAAAGLPPTRLALRDAGGDGGGGGGGGGGGEKALCMHEDYGPTFGEYGSELCLLLNGDPADCVTTVVTTYAPPPGQADPHFLTGAKQFTVAEVEVFRVRA